MEKIIENINGRMYLSDDDGLIASVLEDLSNNNTAFPDVVDLYEYTKNVKVEQEKKDEKGRTVKDKDGKPVIVKVKVPKKALRVYFADGSWTDVVKSDDDANDPIVAILYAIVKRLFGKPTEGGYVTGQGFMNRLKNMSKHIRSEETDEKKKQERIKAKEEEDRKAHEEAVKRKEKSPSLGVRVASLENMFKELLTTLKGKK